MQDGEPMAVNTVENVAPYFDDFGSSLKKINFKQVQAIGQSNNFLGLKTGSGNIEISDIKMYRILYSAPVTRVAGNKITLDKVYTDLMVHDQILIECTGGELFRTEITNREDILPEEIFAEFNNFNIGRADFLFINCNEF